MGKGAAERGPNEKRFGPERGGLRVLHRLEAWREEEAQTKRASIQDDDYWGRPVPGLGPADASILIVGLAPAAHGANRTGRMFTGDRSGDFLFEALHAVGLANQPTATHIGDGLSLEGVRITSPVHCAPPANKPTAEERRNCSPYLARELELLAPTLRTVVILGGFGWQATLAVLRAAGWEVPRPAPKFGHDKEVGITHPDGRTLTLLGCYHVSQQNTFTGRLTQEMLQSVLRKAVSNATRADARTLAAEKLNE